MVIVFMRQLCKSCEDLTEKIGHIVVREEAGRIIR